MIAAVNDFHHLTNSERVLADMLKCLPGFNSRLFLLLSVGRFSFRFSTLLTRIVFSSSSSNNIVTNILNNIFECFENVYLAVCVSTCVCVCVCAYCSFMHAYVYRCVCMYDCAVVVEGCICFVSLFYRKNGLKGSFFIYFFTI